MFAGQALSLYGSVLVSSVPFPSPLSLYLLPSELLFALALCQEILDLALDTFGRGKFFKCKQKIAKKSRDDHLVGLPSVRTVVSAGLFKRSITLDPASTLVPYSLSTVMLLSS